MELIVLFDSTKTAYIHYYATRPCSFGTSYLSIFFKVSRFSFVNMRIMKSKFNKLNRVVFEKTVINEITNPNITVPIL